MTTTPPTMALKGGLDVLQDVSFHGALNVGGTLIVQDTCTLAGTVFSADDQSVLQLRDVHAADMTTEALTCTGTATLATVDVEGPVTFSDVLTAEADVTLGTDGNSNLTLKGTVTCEQHATFDSLVLMDAGARVTGGSLDAATVNTSGLVTAAAGLKVTAGLLEANGGLTVPPGADTSVSTLGVSGASTFDADVTLRGASTVLRAVAATFTAAVTAQGLLTASAGAAVDGALTVTGGETTLEALSVTGAATFVEDVTLASGAAFGGDATVAGDMTIEGAAVLEAGVTVTGTASLAVLNASGPANLSGGLTVTQDTSVVALTASGATTLSGGLAVTGATTVAALTASATLEANAGATVRAGMDVYGGSTLHGTTTLAGDTSFEGDSAWSTGKGLSVPDGDVTMGGAVNVTGVLTCSQEALLEGGLNVTGAVGVIGDVNVTGNLDTTDLNVTGAAILGSVSCTGLAVTGDASVTGGELTAETLVVTQDATMSAALTVTGAAALNGGLTTSALAAVILGGDATVGGELSVSGVAALNGGLTTGALAAVTFGGDATVTGALTAASLAAGALTATVSVETDALTVLGELVATTGAAALGAVTATSLETTTLTAGSATVDGALESATASIAGVLDVAGAAIFTDTLRVTLDATLLADVAVTGNVSAADVTVANVTASGDIGVAGDLAAAADVSIGGDLQVTGDSSMTGGLTVDGIAEVDGLTVTDDAAFDADVAVEGDVTVTGALTAPGTCSLGPVTCANLTSTSDLRYAGTLYQNGYPIKFGPVGADFTPPAIYILPSAVVTSSCITLSLDPVQQTALGVWGLMLPQINSLTVTAQLTDVDEGVGVVLATLSPELITEVSLYCYDPQPSGALSGAPDPDDSTRFVITGLRPGQNYTVGLYYSNDIGSSAAYYATGLDFATAAPPEAPSLTAQDVSDGAGYTFDRITFSLHAPVTDSANPAEDPQPDVHLFRVSYAETSTIADRAGASAHTGQIDTVAPTSSPVDLMCGTVYEATAVVYSRVLPSDPSPPSDARAFYTGFDDDRFATGLTLLATSLAAPSGAASWPPAAYISRSGAALTSADVLTKASWTSTIDGVRVNLEPHTPDGYDCVDWTVTLTPPGGGADDVVTVSTAWDTFAAGTFTVGTASLGVEVPEDANTGGEAGFFKTTAVTVGVVSALPSDSAYSVVLQQKLHRDGAWVYADGAVTYVTQPPPPAPPSPYEATLVFRVDDTAAAPEVVGVTEKAGSRAVETCVSISGLPSLPSSATALQAVMAVEVRNPGRVWHRPGPAAVVTGEGVTGSTANTLSACAPLYEDATLTSSPSTSAPLSSTTPYFRSVPVTLDTAALGDAVLEGAPFEAVATNIVGEGLPSDAALTSFRYDGASLSHPHVIGAGQSPEFGERVVADDNTTPFTTLASVQPYDHAQVIVSNATEPRYDGEAGLCEGLHSGATGLWNSDWSLRAFDMGAAVFQNYSQSGSATRYATFRWPGVNTSTSFHHIRVTFVGGEGGDVGGARLVLYKYVDDVDGSETTPWKDLSVASTGSITTGADGSGGRFASSASRYVTSTTVPANDDGTIYVRVGIPADSNFTFRAVRITDFTTAALLEATFPPP